MKSMISILALVLSISFANAQQGGQRQQRSPEEMAKMQVERLTKELNLNKSQQDSIHKYVLATSTEQQNIFKNAGDNREVAMKSFQALREKQNAKIKTFLNEDQIKKYDELEKQRSQRSGGQRGQRPNNTNN